MTDQERSACSAALAEQYAVGRLTMDEFKARTDLLYAATTRAELAAVFAGLPRIVFPTAKLPTEQMPTWRWVVAGLAVGLAVPFFGVGLLFLLFQSGRSDLVTSTILAGGAVVWALLAWWWVSRSRRNYRRGLIRYAPRG